MENAADQEAQAGSTLCELDDAITQHSSAHIKEEPFWETADCGRRTALSPPDIKEEPRPPCQRSPDPGEEGKLYLPAEHRGERTGHLQEEKLSSAPIGQIPLRTLPYLQNTGQSAACSAQCSPHEERRPDIKEEPLSDTQLNAPEEFSSTEGHRALYIKEEWGVLESGRVRSPVRWAEVGAPCPVRPCGEVSALAPPYRKDEVIVGRDAELSGAAPSGSRSPASHSPLFRKEEDEDDSLTDVDSFIHPDESEASSPLWWDEDGFRDCSKTEEEPRLPGADGPAGAIIAHKAAAKKPFSCPSCGKCYLRREHYEAHSKTHLREKPYACAHCDKSFNIRPSLLRHQSVHTGVKPHPCPQCHKAFQTRSGLVHHQRAHSGDKPQYKCEQCGKVFSTRSGYTYHRGAHTANKPYKCAHCTKRFANSTMCARHQQVHTDRPNSCPHCARCFSHKSNLRVHLRCHTGEKPFTCPECGRSFTAKGTLNQHLRIHTGEKPYRCPTCGKGFKQQWSLTQHSRTHH